MRCDFPRLELFDETGFNPDHRRRRLVKAEAEKVGKVVEIRIKSAKY